MRCLSLEGQILRFFSISDLENAFFDLIVGTKEKNEENKKVSPLNRATFLFSSIFSVFPLLNRKSRFSRSETLNKSEVSIGRADIKFF